MSKNSFEARALGAKAEGMKVLTLRSVMSQRNCGTEIEGSGSLLRVPSGGTWAVL